MDKFITNTVVIGAGVVGLAIAKDAGRMRVEGSDYIVKDGDVFHFRFNVW